MKGFIIFTVSLLSYLAVAQPINNENKPEEKCDGHDLRFNQTAAEIHLMKCLDKYAPPKELSSDASDKDKTAEMVRRHELVQNNTCLEVCFHQELKFLDGEGAFNKDGSDSFFDDVIPIAELANKVKLGVAKCASEKGKGFSMDNKCETYADFFDCTTEVIKQVCHPKPSSTRK